MRRNRNSPNPPDKEQKVSPRGTAIARKQQSSGSIPPPLLKGSDAKNVSPPISFPALNRSPGKVIPKPRSQAASPRSRQALDLPQSSSKAFLLQPSMRLPVRRDALVRRTRAKDEAYSRIAGVATASKVGRTRAVPKTHNQDSLVVVQHFGNRSDAYLFGVFDGHGSYGHDISQFLREHFEDYVVKGMNSTDLGNPELVIDGLKDGFRSASMGLRKEKVDSANSGSTCLVILIIGDICYCGNVGDSRALLLRQTAGKWTSIPLSRDHKPSVEEERSRILERGGVIAQHCNAAGLPSGPLRVWLPDQPAPGLAMTRSMGDRIASKIGVTSDPEVMQLMLSREDQALVLASDGLWEMLSNEDVAEIVGRHSDSTPSQITDQLMEEAQHRWACSGTNWDDTTLVFVRLRAA